MTTKGVPFLYQGEELGMEVMDVKNINNFRDEQIFTNKKYFFEERGFDTEEYFEYQKQFSRDMSRSIMS